MLNIRYEMPYVFAFIFTTSKLRIELLALCNISAAVFAEVRWIYGIIRQSIIKIAYFAQVLGKVSQE